MVVVLHDLAQAAWLADRVAVLHRGRLYAAGSPIETIATDTLRDVFGVDACISTDASGLAIRVLGPCDPLRSI